MSKLELQSKAKLRSGVSFEESLEATLLVPSLYERIGEDGLYQLSLLFYDRVFADQENVWFLNILARSGLEKAQLFLRAGRNYFNHRKSLPMGVIMLNWTEHFDLIESHLAATTRVPNQLESLHSAGSKG